MAPNTSVAALASVASRAIILPSAKPRVAAAGCTVGALAWVQEAAASSASASALVEELAHQIPERRYLGSGDQIPERRDLGSGDRPAARWLLALALAVPAARARCSLLAPLE